MVNSQSLSTRPYRRYFLACLMLPNDWWVDFQQIYLLSALLKNSASRPITTTVENDHVHTDPEKQYIFTPQSEFDSMDTNPKLYALYPNAIKQFKASYNAHKALLSYVEGGHLYYAAFHTKEVLAPICRPTYCNEWEAHYKEYLSGFYHKFHDHIYLFAVGVSPHSRNLVGVFTIRPSHMSDHHPIIPIMGSTTCASLSCFNDKNRKLAIPSENKARLTTVLVSKNQVQTTSTL